MTTWLDPAVLLRACDGDPAVLAKISAALHRQLPTELARAASCLEASDAPALRESAHKLCGMIAVVSTSGSDEAAALEELAADGELQRAAESFAAVRALSEELLDGLGSLSIEALRALAQRKNDDDGG